MSGSDARVAYWGKRVRDVVRDLPDREQLLIASCRPKAWNRSTTISHEDKPFEVAAKERAQGPQPFISHPVEEAGDWSRSRNAHIVIHRKWLTEKGNG